MLASKTKFSVRQGIKQQVLSHTTYRNKWRKQICIPELYLAHKRMLVLIPFILINICPTMFTR